MQTSLRALYGYALQLALALWGIKAEGLWSSRLRITRRKATAGLLGGSLVFLSVGLIEYQAIPWGAIDAQIQTDFLTFFVILVLTGPVEELLFRGYFFTRWAVRYPSAGGTLFFAILASMVFAAFHVFHDVTFATTLQERTIAASRVVITAMAIQFFIGLVLTFCYWTSHNIVYAMVIHALYDIALTLHLFESKPALLLVYIGLALLASVGVRRLSIPRQERSAVPAWRVHKARRVAWILYLLVVATAWVVSTVDLSIHGFHRWDYSDTLEGAVQLLALSAYIFRFRLLNPRAWQTVFVIIVLYDVISSRLELGATTNTFALYVIARPMYVAMFLYSWRSPHIWKRRGSGHVDATTQE